MKRFDFRLERVRRWRVERADIEELALERLRAEKSRFEAALRCLKSELALAESGTLNQPSIDPVELTSLGTYRLRMRHDIRDLENRLSQQEAKIVAQRERVMEARRQAELLGRLRAKAFQAWQGAVNKEQEELAAETFLTRWKRRG